MNEGVCDAKPSPIKCVLFWSFFVNGEGAASSDGFRLLQHSSLLYSETSTIRTQTPDRPNIITLHSFPPRSIFYNGKNKGGIDEEEEEEGNRGEGCPRSNGWGSRRRGSVARKCTGGGREEGEGLGVI